MAALTPSSSPHAQPPARQAMPHRQVGKVSPSAAFAPGVEVSGATRWLSISGQLGRDANGDVPEGIEEQAELAWKNLAAVLQAANMQIADLVDVTIYLVRREDGPLFDKVRLRWLQGHRTAATKIFVSGFVDPRMLCEIQATAAA